MTRLLLSIVGVLWGPIAFVAFIVLAQRELPCVVNIWVGLVLLGFVMAGIFSMEDLDNRES